MGDKVLFWAKISFWWIRKEIVWSAPELRDDVCKLCDHESMIECASVRVCNASNWYIKYRLWYTMLYLIGLIIVITWTIFFPSSFSSSFYSLCSVRRLLNWSTISVCPSLSFSVRLSFPFLHILHRMIALFHFKCYKIMKNRLTGHTHTLSHSIIMIDSWSRNWNRFSCVSVRIVRSTSCVWTMLFVHIKPCYEKWKKTKQKSKNKRAIYS